MSNNGDKVAGIKIPKEVVEEVKEDIIPPVAVKPAPKVVTQVNTPSRPNSNFSDTVGQGSRAEHKVEDSFKLELQVFKEGILKATTREEIVRVQEKLLKTIRGIVSNKDNAAFRKGWTTLLNYINVNGDVINMKDVFKYIYMFNFDARTQRMYNSLMFLAINTAQPNKRYRRGDIEFSTLRSDLSILGNTAVQNLITFYDN